MNLKHGIPLFFLLTILILPGNAFAHTELRSSKPESVEVTISSGVVSTQIPEASFSSDRQSGDGVQAATVIIILLMIVITLVRRRKK